MVAFIVYFFPAVASVWFFERLRKTTLDKKAWLYRFAWNTMLINGICFTVKKWFLHTATVSMSSFSADMTPDIACNYLIMAIPLAVVIAVAEAFLTKHATIELEDLDAPQEEHHESQNEN